MSINVSNLTCFWSSESRLNLERLLPFFSFHCKTQLTTPISSNLIFVGSASTGRCFQIFPPLPSSPPGSTLGCGTNRSQSRLATRPGQPPHSCARQPEGIVRLKKPAAALQNAPCSDVIWAVLSLHRTCPSPRGDQDHSSL